MRLSYKALKKYAVKTVSGKDLGRVRDIVFDADSQSILQYDVSKTMGMGAGHLIHQSQIVRFEDGVMLVEDTAGKETAASETAAPLTKTKPVMMRKEEIL